MREEHQNETWMKVLMDGIDGSRVFSARILPLMVSSVSKGIHQRDIREEAFNHQQ